MAIVVTARRRITLVGHASSRAYRALEISPAIFDEVAAELARSLDHFNVPEREKREVLAAFAAHKGEVVEGYAGQY
jgi:hypothetical protein